MATIVDLQNVVDVLQSSVSTELQQVIDLLTASAATQAGVDDAVARLTALNDALVSDDVPATP